jgi:hypothetical protein
VIRHTKSRKRNDTTIDILPFNAIRKGSIGFINGFGSSFITQTRKSIRNEIKPVKRNKYLWDNDLQGKK